MNGPAFIGIGAQKAGTTWLWDNLRRHPQLWLPPVKELHWFDAALRHPQGIGYRHRQGLARYRPLLRRPSWHDARWLWQFYRTLPRADAAYGDLFRSPAGRRAGEITPAYAALPAATVQSLHASLPADCRILLVLREPVDRLWSALRMQARRQGLDLAALDIDTLDAMACHPVHALRSDYARTLAHWGVFGDRLGVFFYEDLQQDPAAFLRTVLQFLAVDADWRSPLLRQARNRGSDRLVLPPPLRQRWRQRFMPAVQAVAAHSGRLPAAWGAL